MGHSRLALTFSITITAALLGGGCDDDTTQVQQTRDLAVPSDLAAVDAHMPQPTHDLAGADLARAADLAGDDGGSDGGGHCAGVGDGTPCDDGNACTRADTCQSGVCVGANPVSCSASDQCHVAGTCNPSTGACSNPPATDGTACNDGNACTRTDACQSGVCVGANPVSCSASDQCHVAGTCNPSTGACSNPPATDGNACNDGNACTQSDSCVGGVCTGANPVTCTASDQCHVAGTCNPSSGACSDPPATDGKACNDGNACSRSDSCVGGTCTGSTPVTCTALGECYTVGTCDPSSGACSNPFQPVTTPCSTGQCDGSGNCVAQPTVTSTSPGDGASVVATSPISITFSTAMDPTTLATQGTIDGGCQGTIQVSYDDFNTCVTFATNDVTMSPDNRTATITPVPGLLVNMTFKVLVTTQAKSAVGLALASQYMQATGFTTGSPMGSVPVENETGSSLESDYCVVQFPVSLTLPTGTDTGQVYGQIYETGMTDTGGPPSASIHAQVGFGPLTDNPEYAVTWSWTDAVYNQNYGNNAEYMASFTAPSTAGSYGYVYRMSIDGGTTWTYCDLAGAGSNAGLSPFNFDSIAIMTVTP